MSTNLVASAVKLLTPELLSRIASTLGVSPAMIEKAVAAGVPGLLAAFASLTNRPGGAAKLAEAVAQQPPGLITDIANAGPARQTEVVDNGFNLLTSLLGSGTLSSVVAALGRYSGLGESSTKALTGLLGPLVLSVLGQQRGKLDASGLTQLLQAQKSNIASALPSGFASQLADVGIGERVRETTAWDPRREETSYGSWILPVLGLIALGALAWYLLGRHNERNVATLPTTQSEAPMQTGNARDFIVTAAEEKSWIGRPVFSSDNRKVGEIVEIKRGPDNKVTDVIFDAGTILGMGATHYQVTSDQIQEVRPDGLVVTLKESQIEAAPQGPGKAQQQAH